MSSITRRNLITRASIATAVLALTTRAGADQPVMHDAFTLLKDAERELEGATHDKGGHRKKALQLVRQAMEEVRRGMDYDRTHLTPNENHR